MRTVNGAIFFLQPAARYFCLTLKHVEGRGQILSNKYGYGLQGRNHGENLGSTSAMVGRIFPPPGWDKVKASENLGATAVTPVAPADTSLACIPSIFIETSHFFGES